MDPQGGWTASLVSLSYMYKHCRGQEGDGNHFYVVPSEITQGHLHLEDAEGITTVPKSLKGDQKSCLNFNQRNTTF